MDTTDPHAALHESTGCVWSKVEAFTPLLHTDAATVTALVLVVVVLAHSIGCMTEGCWHELAVGTFATCGVRNDAGSSETDQATSPVPNAESLQAE